MIDKNTERVEKEITKTLKEQEIIIEAFSDIIYAIDLNGKLVKWDKRIEALTGLSRKELKGKPIVELFEEKNRKNITKFLNETSKKGWFEGEAALFIKDGTTVPFEWTFALLKSRQGKTIGFTCIGKDITERKRAEEIVKQKLAFEETIACISSRFVGIPNINEAINVSLGDIGKCSGADRVYLFLFRENGTMADNTHEWCVKEVSPQINNLQNLSCKLFPWWMEKLYRGEVIYIADVSKLPEEARAEKKILEMQGIKSLLVLPLYVEKKLIGFMGFDNIMNTGEWSDDKITLLRTFAEVIENALMRWHLEETLRQQEELFKTLSYSLPTGIYVVRGRKFQFFNPQFQKQVGYDEDELVDMDSLAIVYSEDREIVRKKAIKSLKERLSLPYEFRYVTKDGKIRWVMETVASIWYKGGQATLGTFMDISERKQMEEQLRYLSLHDSLTGLYNRNYFEEEMHRLEKGRHTLAGLIICDIDRLKLINDTLGHRVGDKLLMTAANIIKSPFRADDIVARIGGDEFAVLLPNCNREIVEDACQRIRNAIVKHNKENPGLFLGMSIGFAISNEIIGDAGNLFKTADNNMYREKLHNSKITCRVPF
ncbi:MAG: hypothetical protein STSR0004_18200 [Peptococcaceae bacterium]